MRRLLYGLGAATLAIIVMAGTGLGVFIYRGITLDASSKAYVDGAVPAIAANWDRQQLLEVYYTGTACQNHARDAAGGVRHGLAARSHGGVSGCQGRGEACPMLPARAARCRHFMWRR